MKNQEKEENKLISQRREKLDSLREKGTAFPNSFRRNTNSDDLNERFRNKAKEELESYDEDFAIAGRIIARRGPFIVIQDVYGTMQLYVDKKNLSEIEIEKISLWDIGDIVGSHGKIRKSGKGDLYIYMKESFLLTKSLRPLPEKYHGLSDVEIKYRQRYLDLMVSEDSRNVFKNRIKIVSQIRKFFEDQSYFEVETPMMHTIAGGASAKPFITHHNSLDMKLFLRIAPELYLKRLIIGGFEKVFEINRSFRNEGLSVKHNPEFTMIEFYAAYEDYNYLMNMIEELIKNLVACIGLKNSFDYQEYKLDFSKKFERINFHEALCKYCKTINKENIQDYQFLANYCKSNNIDISIKNSLYKTQLDIFEKNVETKLINPTFVTEYPTAVSPLSRRSDDNPDVVERFELFIAGREIANGFSELNDPQDQAKRFKEQLEKDDEKMNFDSDFITAMEYGMPPTAGAGIGIDRLVMLLTNSASIRDVLLFPLMKPKN